MNIYLASKSPRRQELLQQMEIPFTLLLLDTPELVIPGESPEDYSIRVTKEKLTASWDYIVQENLPRKPILCADTEVIVNGTIVGKPRDREDAFAMLKSYSGSQHKVITSVGLMYQDYQKIKMSTTYVTFSSLTDEDINHYLDSNTYLDKAGAYGIQSYIGQFISGIEGCFYSVMGLPLSLVREVLDDFKKSGLM